jgi:tetratricopeptide (TPR) repeat protein
VFPCRLSVAVCIIESGREGDAVTGNPKTQLQAARLQMGWSQPRLMLAMRSAAPAVGFQLPPSDESLKTQITRWENGRARPDESYRRLFRAVYGLSDRELGFPSGSDVPVRRQAQASDDAMHYFANLLAEHLRADNHMGHRFVVDPVRQQARQLADLARGARGPVRTPVLTMAFRYSEFLGWLCQDAGQYEEAMAVTDRARDMVIELGDPLWISYLMMRKSNIATDAGDPAGAAEMIDQAAKVAHYLPPRLHATILRQKANAYAGLGELRTCAAAIDKALEVVGAEDPEGAELASYCTEPYVAMEAGACWMQLGQPAKALSTYQLASREWPDALRRDHGLSLARLASAQAEVGAIDEACTTGSRAIAVANQTGSVRTLLELRRLRDALRPWERHGDAALVRASVASLVATAS